MDTRLIVLKLFLDELDIRSDIETVDDRKRVQKAVYLGQLSGVDLGYRFGWYLKGPYSPALTKDYYSLAESLALGDASLNDHELQDSVRDQLRKIRPLLQVPEGVSLQQEDWLELVSSIHYLRKVSGLDTEGMIQLLTGKKRHLVPYAQFAETALADASLPPKARL